jgi:hypothetical protein
MSSFLTHVNDARNYIARLILHERDSIEDQAASQNRTPQSLWNEAVGVWTAPGVGRLSERGVLLPGESWKH